MLAQLLRELEPFQPTLIGTYPLGVQVEGSDLDIACSAQDLDLFEVAARRSLAAWGIAPRVERLPLHPEACLVSFAWSALSFELFCQALPVTRQAGFRHLIVEGRLLVLGGEPLQRLVRARKRTGLKTEPAFAELLGLGGDPYAALLALEGWPEERLHALVANALRQGEPLASAGDIAIVVHEGDRSALAPLFALADDSADEIARYLPQGRVLVARLRGRSVGHLQLVPAPQERVLELKSLAVEPALRGCGLGRRLVHAGLAHARAAGAQRLIVTTATADVDNLRFYQRLGFRLSHVERDAFTPARGYAPGLTAHGIPILDRVWLDLEL